LYFENNATNLQVLLQRIADVEILAVHNDHVVLRARGANLLAQTVVARPGGVDEKLELVPTFGQVDDGGEVLLALHQRDFALPAIPATRHGDGFGRS